MVVGKPDSDTVWNDLERGYELTICAIAVLRVGGAARLRPALIQVQVWMEGAGRRKLQVEELQTF